MIHLSELHVQPPARIVRGDGGRAERRVKRIEAVKRAGFERGISVGRHADERFTGQPGGENADRRVLRIGETNRSQVGLDLIGKRNARCKLARDFE